MSYYRLFRSRCKTQYHLLAPLAFSKYTSHRFSKSGGPFQWFHRYDRCSGGNGCGNIFGDLNTNDKCCKDLEQDMKCNLECQKSISLDESAIPSDTGFFWKFQSDPETGIPSGCPGFPNNWPNGNFDQKFS